MSAQYQELVNLSSSPTRKVNIPLEEQNIFQYKILLKQ